MSDLVLEHLKILRSESKQNRDDLAEVKQHVIIIRHQMADVLKDHVLLHERIAAHELRLERIERRLQLDDPSVDQP